MDSCAHTFWLTVEPQYCGSAITNVHFGIHFKSTEIFFTTRVVMKEKNININENYKEK